MAGMAPLGLKRSCIRLSISPFSKKNGHRLPKPHDRHRAWAATSPPTRNKKATGKVQPWLKISTRWR
jgi:hypothetical protein